MTNLYHGVQGRTLEFEDVRLFEASDTYVYSCHYLGSMLFAETVAEPTTRELMDSLLVAAKEEDRIRSLVHRIGDKFNYGNI